ncbi:CHAT domain-containing protein [Mycena rebaudengoi]|nr:CHAT domain-containing protein [Mycena rebaudengoi]
MPRIIHLQDIEIKSLSPLHFDLPPNIPMSAQLIINEHIILQTVPSAPEPSQNSWKLEAEWMISDACDTFVLALICQNTILATRVLGYVKIGRDNALVAGENKIVICLAGDLGPIQNCLDKMINNAQAGIKVEAQELCVMHERILFLPTSNDKRGNLLGTLGHICFKQWETSDMMDCLNHSIYAYKDAVRDDPINASYHEDLGISLRNRFDRLGDLNDLTEAILKLEEAVLLTPDRHPDQPARVNNLGVSLQSRFERLGDLSDINEAISKKQEAVFLTPDGHPDRPGRLNDLGISLQSRFKRLGDLGDLTAAISNQEQAVHLTPDGHPDRPRRLNDLGISLQSRFKRLGNLGDLTAAISNQEQAVFLTLHGHPDRPRKLNNLGIFLQLRFERLGDLGDLNEAISMKQEAVHLTSDGHPDRPHRLNALGISLESRFKRLGDLGDLTAAISNQEQVVHLTSDGHPDRPHWLNNLGISLKCRFERLGDLGDLNAAISNLEKAVHLTPDGHPDRPRRLNNLGTFLKIRFERLGDLCDLNEAISKEQEAVFLTPDGHPDKPGMFNNLGNSLESRFKRLRGLGDLNEAISMKREAIFLTPDGHPDKPAMFNNLGNALESCFQRLGDHADHQEAILHFASAACSITGPAHVRFLATTNWAYHTSFIKCPSSLEACEKALHLLPEVAWLGLSITDRHHQICEAGSVVRDAAAAAIYLGQLEKAVEWLEQGRSVIWGQLLSLRTPFEDLQQKHSQLADELIFLSTQLEGATTQRDELQLLASGSQQSLQSISNQAHENVLKRDVLLKKIRELEGFQQFLLPKTISELMPAAQKRPVVFLNVSQVSCDALVLHFSGRVTHIPLPQFTPDQVKTLTESVNCLMYMGRGNIDRLYGEREGGSAGLEESFSYILGELWVRLVKPVLNALAITTPIKQDLPRIWWCPTGPLTSLPIHAAGLYGKEYLFGSKLSDFVISSYTPSLAALIQGFRPGSQLENKGQMLVVAQPSAAGQNYIPGTQDEINQIQDCAKGKMPVCSLVEHEASVARVEDEMTKSGWVHFACHGVQDARTPTKSSLLLAGSSQLTLSRIIQLNLPHAELAFLSACHTATGDKKLQEESVHLAAGMLLAGYRGVIATMWSIMDNDAPQVAKDVYKHLFKTSPPDSTRAAEALHLAVQNLREGSGETKSFFHWVPFIHVGV